MRTRLLQLRSFSLLRLNGLFAGSFLLGLLAYITVSPFTSIAFANDLTDESNPGSISGIVYNAGNPATPLEAIDVHLYGPGVDTSVCTNANGEYSFNSVPVGEGYRVEAADEKGIGACSGDTTPLAHQFWENQLFWDHASQIHIADSESVTGIDFHLGAGGSVSGTITTDEGDPVQNACVWALNSDNMERIAFFEWSDASGGYTFQGIPVGSNVLIQVEANCAGQHPNLANEFYKSGGSVIDSTNAEELTIEEDVTKTGIDFQLDPAGSITGVVQNENNNPLDQIKVFIHGDNWGQATCTNSNGEYTFASLPLNTSFKVEAAPLGKNDCGGSENYAHQFWNNTLQWGEATPIEMTESNLTFSDINFHLAPGGGVSGFVYGPDGNPLSGVCLNFTDATPERRDIGGWGETGDDGSYQIFGLPVGEFLMRADPTCGGKNINVVSHWYNFEGSTPVDQEASTLNIEYPGFEATDVNFNLEQGGQISGRVTAATGGAPLENIPVSIEGPNYGMSACTDSNGEFTIHSVRFNDEWRVHAAPLGENSCGGSNHFAHQFYQATFTHENATLVALDPDHTALSDINFSLQSGGGISGLVTDKNDLPLSGVCINAISPQMQDLGGWGQTNDQGEFSFWGLPAGTPLHLFFDPNCTGENPYVLSEWYTANGEGALEFDQSAEITLSPASMTSDLDIKLDQGAGVVKGAVFDDQGNPLPNIRVHLHSDVNGKDACTDSQGKYQFGQVPFDIEWRVEAAPIGSDNACGGSNEKAHQFWPETFSWEEAGLVKATSAQPLTDEIDFHLAPGGGISGVVNGPDHHPLAHVCINLSSSIDPWTDIGGWGETNDLGEFEFWGLPVGNVYVQADPNCSGASPNISREYIGDGNSVLLESQAHPVVITQNQLHTGLRFDLDYAGTISGVVQSSGVPVPDMAVLFMNPDANMGFTCTDNEGKYTIDQVVVDIPWKIIANPAWGNPCKDGEFSDYAQQFWNHTLRFDLATPITITPSTLNVTNIDFDLVPGGGVSGTVTAEDGKPLAGVCIQATSTQEGRPEVGYWIATNTNGQYTFAGIPSGEIFVRTVANCTPLFAHVEDEWYAAGDSTTQDADAEPVTISTGQITTGIDFKLDLTFSSTITKESGGELTAELPGSNQLGVEIPGGAIEEDGLDLVLEPVAEEEAGNGFSSVGLSFTLQAYINDAPVEHYVFQQPIKVELRYTDEQLGDRDESTLTLQTWDQESQTWVDAACGAYERFPDENRLVAPICHLSEFRWDARILLFLPSVVR